MLNRNRNGAWKTQQANAILTHFLLTSSSGEELTASWYHGEHTRGLVVTTGKYEAARNDVIARAKALQAQ